MSMEKNRIRPSANSKKMRMSYSRQKEVLEMPNLIEVQKDSYRWFIDTGLKEVLRDMSEITDYSGNLVLGLPLISGTGEALPLTLSAYFNSYDANKKLSVGKSSSSRTSAGKGFRLNVQQTVLPSSQYGLTGTALETWPYVYTDGDGTEHYIGKVTNDDGSVEYKDEDGLGLTLYTTLSEEDSGITATYKIKDKSGTIYYFNARGNLGIIKDSNGNRLTISYKAADTANGLPYGTRISKITDGAGHSYTFSYYQLNNADNDYISSITDNSDRTLEFEMNGGYLTSVKYYDSSETTIVYESSTAATGLINYVTSKNGYSLNFDYDLTNNQARVNTVKEAGSDSTLGQIVTFDRSAYNKTKVRSGGVDGYHVSLYPNNGADDIVTTLQFDNEGKTVSQQVSFGSGEEVGAGSYSYTSGTLGSANKIDSSASLGKNTENLVSNGIAESLDNWEALNGEGVNTTKYVTDTSSYVGTKAIAIRNNSFTGTATSYFRQKVTGLSAEESYTFSAYVRVGALTTAYNNANKGAYLQLTAYNSSGNPIETVSSERLTSKTDTAINNGWRRISVTFTLLPQNTATLCVYLCLKDVTGTVFFDGIQLEEGTVASSCNLLENGSFQKTSSGLPQKWTALNFASGDTVVTTAYKDGTKSLKVTGSEATSKGIYQTVPVQANENDTYIVSGWGNAYAVNNTYHSNALFEIAVRVTYDCKDAQGNVTTVNEYKDSATFNTTINGWQYATSAFSLKMKNPESGKTYTPKSIMVMPRYNYQSNHAYFDHIQLIKDVAGSYIYDNEGNLVSTVKNSEQKYNMEYNDNNDLKSYTDAAGYTTTATYDSNRNLTATTSPAGVKTAYTYMGNGMLCETELQNRANSAAIKTESIPDPYHNGTIISGVSDQHGNLTSYSIHLQNGVVEEINYPNGQRVCRGFDSNYTKLTSVTSGSSAVRYTYSGDRITEINFSSSDGESENYKSETYKMVYDSFGNRTSTKVGNSELSENFYDSRNGVLLRTEYGNGDTTSFTYNTLGLVKNISYNGTQKFSWEYTSTGGVISHTDNVNNRKYLYDYDTVGRLIRQEIRTADGSSHVGSSEFAYDVRNNVTKIANEFGGYTAVDEYLYSADSGNANASAYAKDNLISRYKIANSSGYVDYTYDSLNRLKLKALKTSGGTLSTEYFYKPSQRNSDEGTTKYTTTQLGREIVDNTAFTYYYDSVGNITRVLRSYKNQGVDKTADYKSYKYDTESRLNGMNNNRREKQ